MLSGAVGAVTGALGGGGGTVQPLAPVQGVLNQVTGALSGGNPAGALTGALNTATGTLSNAVGTVTGHWVMLAVGRTRWRRCKASSIK